MSRSARSLPPLAAERRPARRHRRRRCAVLAVVVLCFMLPASSATGQDGAPSLSAAAPDQLNIDNPIAMIEDATEALPGFEGGLSATLNILILLTVLSLAPAIIILCTSFVRIVIVLALLRQAMGTQSLPPSQVIIGLSLFMTFLVMAPTFDKIRRDAIVPLNDGEIHQLEAWHRAKQPLRDFMFGQLESKGNWADVYMVLNYRGVDISEPQNLQRRDVDMLTLVPAFILSELKTAFLIGFRIYLPFLIIDMVVASLLISMGMFMLPPVLISLPFKLLLFVLVDGWHLVVGGLLESFRVTVVT